VAVLVEPDQGEALADSLADDVGQRMEEPICGRPGVLRAVIGYRFVDYVRLGPD
jgi:hypothetical protein